MIALRFAIYGELLTLLGLIAYPFHAGASGAFKLSRLPLLILLSAGLMLSTLVWLATVASMSGTDIMAIDRNILAVVTQDTVAGKAFITRSIALILAIGLALMFKPRWPVLAALTAAVATLAWSGHAAVTEGWVGALHRGADVAHLLAAAMWLGTLVVLLRQIALLARRDGEGSIDAVLAELQCFATAGSLIVVTILASGAINILAIIGPDNLAKLPDTRYGLLFFVKLSLFLVMLCCAGLNRWVLAPRLAASTNEGANRAAFILGLSIAIELLAAVMILGAVAWLGMLDPTQSL